STSTSCCCWAFCSCWCGAWTNGMQHQRCGLTVVQGFGPVPAIRQLLSKVGRSLNEIDLFEINEAFVAQLLAVAHELDIDKNKLNIWGGATAIGHPLGATGIRIALTLSRQLQHMNVK